MFKTKIPSFFFCKNQSIKGFPLVLFGVLGGGEAYNFPKLLQRVGFACHAMGIDLYLFFPNHPIMCLRILLPVFRIFTLLLDAFALLGVSRLPCPGKGKMGRGGMWVKGK